MNSFTGNRHVKTEAFRLGPGADLKGSIENWLKANHVEAAIVLSCVGSLKHACVRLANAPEPSDYEGFFEIVALSGTLSSNGSHLHIAISDAGGKVIGGHLSFGSMVYTTAELVVGILDDLIFTREPDQKTGFNELMIKKLRGN
jgi:predicted DNA-binding protein with PD1-like motif